MSSIASFIELPVSALPGLREVAIPPKKLYGIAKDNYYSYLLQNGREVVHYRWSGDVVTAVLHYLGEKHDIDLTHSDLDELADFLTEARGSSHYLLTASQTPLKDRLAPRLFAEDELEDYLRELYGMTESGMGKAMLGGIDAFHKCLSGLGRGSVVLVSVG